MECFIRYNLTQKIAQLRLFIILKLKECNGTILAWFATKQTSLTGSEEGLRQISSGILMASSNKEMPMDL